MPKDNLLGYMYFKIDKMVAFAHAVQSRDATTWQAELLMGLRPWGNLEFNVSMDTKCADCSPENCLEINCNIVSSTNYDRNQSQ